MIENIKSLPPGASKYLDLAKLTTDMTKAAGKFNHQIFNEFYLIVRKIKKIHSLTFFKECSNSVGALHLATV